ncbi:MAG: hypothetical protein OJF49_002852 [Ktedonobacterales bacterium]|jgi:hypothetical protein|nr:MAG: hypothetical protein OJF49_002852 [Ktedonobacterales bacterium]
MTLTIDHVTIAGPNLDAMLLAFKGIGLTPEYGGPHAGRPTHMALIGFDDGAYIELISTVAPGEASGWWDAAIRENGGPCAWAVGTHEIAAEAARIAGLGVPVRGPTAMGRERPDGTRIAWELAFVGADEPGALLPFLIQDTTPRELRVRPSASMAGSELRGVGGVVLGVEQIAPAVEVFQRVYGWPAPEMREDDAFGAALAHFAGTPVTLAAPRGDGDAWLAERVARFGAAPCAFVLASGDMEASRGRFGSALGAAGQWFDATVVAWLAPERLGGARLGVMG